MDKHIKILMVRPTTNKLNFVRSIKIHTGCGLKEAKYVCDDLHEKYNNKSRAVASVEVFNKVDISLLSSELKNKCPDGEFIINGGQQFERHVKMLKLGMGDKEDYIHAIKEMVFDFQENKFKGIFELVLNKLSDDELKDIFDKIDYEFI